MKIRAQITFLIKLVSDAKQFTPHKDNNIIKTKKMVK
jgi:hypothetical protein